MKTIKLNDALEVNPRELIRGVVINAPSGANLDQVRKRLRILDALAKANGSPEMQLEDADWELLKSLYAEFKFIKAHQDLVTIYDDIANARIDDRSLV